MNILSNFNKTTPICITCIHYGECEGTVCYGYESEQKSDKAVTLIFKSKTEGGAEE